MINTSRDKLGKSRDIPMPEWFTNLQLEYLTYKLREEMYTREQDEKMFRDISKMKKDKIKTVALRQGIVSIFDSKERMEKYVYDKFSNDCGMPNMQYTPKNKKFSPYWDKYYFFQPGIEIYYDSKTYPILRNFPDSEMVEIIFGKTIAKLPYCEIKRDFEDLFL